MQPMLQSLAGVASQLTQGYGTSSSVVDMLRAINAEQRTEIERLQALVSSREAELKAQRSYLEKLLRCVHVLSGVVIEDPPQDGCVYADLEIVPGLTLTVEAEYAPDVPPSSDDPGEPCLCEAGEVLIQGVWVHIPELIQRLTDRAAIADAIEKQRQADIDDAVVSAHLAY